MRKLATYSEVYTCTAEEWEFARYHSEVHQPDRGSKGIRRANLGCFLGVPATLIIYYVLTSIAVWVTKGELEQWIREFRGNFSTFVLIGSALFFIIPYFTRERKELRKPQPHEKIPYMITDEHGILLNMRNNLAESAILYVNWSSIKNLKIDFTHDLDFYSTSAVYLDFKKVEDFDKVRKYLPDFCEPVQKMYNDRFSLNIASDGRFRGAYGWIQIPKSWLYDGQFERLLRTIEERTGISIEPYRDGVMVAFLRWRNE